MKLFLPIVKHWKTTNCKEKYGWGYLWGRLFFLRLKDGDFYVFFGVGLYFLNQIADAVQHRS